MDRDQDAWDQAVDFLQRIIPMDEEIVSRFICEGFPGVETTIAYGYTFYFYGAGRKHPFATLAHEDNPYDNASQLDRPGVYRLNIGVSREAYRSLFGSHPLAPGASGVVETGHDFTVLDQILPHPVYAPQSWVCVLCPSETTFESQVKPLLEEAYKMAVTRNSRGEE